MSASDLTLSDQTLDLVRGGAPETGAIASSQQQLEQSTVQQDSEAGAEEGSASTLLQQQDTNKVVAEDSGGRTLLEQDNEMVGGENGGRTLDSEAVGSDRGGVAEKNDSSVLLEGMEAQQQYDKNTQDNQTPPSPGQKNEDPPSPGQKSEDPSSPGQKSKDPPSPGQKSEEIWEAHPQDNSSQTHPQVHDTQAVTHPQAKDTQHSKAEDKQTQDQHPQAQEEEVTCPQTQDERGTHPQVQDEGRAPHPQIETRGVTEEGEWQDILGSGQLMKKVLRVGSGTSTRPSQQFRVKVRTRGFLESGKVVDKHSGCWFTVGDGDVVPAWDIAVTLMELGEVAKVKSAPRFAYGEHGKKSVIPPNATITYELELLEVLEPVDLSCISEEELNKIVENKKRRGNELYQDQDYAKATHSYQRGLQAIESYLEKHSMTTDIPPSLQEMQIRCLNNIAAAQLKLKQYKEALFACERVLQAESENVKALYRAGRVQSHLGEMDAAVARLKKALSLQPQDKTIQNELSRAQKKKEHNLQKEKEMYRRMVGSGPKPDKSSSVNMARHTTWGPWPYMAVAGITAVVAMGVAYFITQRH